MVKYNGIGGLVITIAFSIVFVVSSCATFKLPHISKYTEKEKGLDIRFVKVIGGGFLMGGNGEVDSTATDELPLHNVKLNTYYISAYEVTNKQYAIFCNETGRKLPHDAENRPKNSPVIYVSWVDAIDFCKWLSEMSNKDYRLPTEAEWEYAARGGIKGKGYIYAGSNDLNAVASFITCNSYMQDTLQCKIIDSVGKKKPNELGIYDMSGSVWEWCYDTYDKHYYSSPKENPINLKPSVNKVARGGGWSSSPKFHAVSNRDYDYFLRTDNDLGFRVVLVISNHDCPLKKRTVKN